MLVSVLTHNILKLLRIGILFSLSFSQVVVLDLFMLSEQVFDFLFISAKNSSSLAIKICLNRLQLLIVMISHLAKLPFHSHYQSVNILRHLLDRLDVVAVLLINLLLELPDELLLVGDNFSTSGFLCLDILQQNSKKTTFDSLLINMGVTKGNKGNITARTE